MIEHSEAFSNELEAFLQKSLSSNLAFIDTVTHYLNSSGGKRIRPRLCYLVGQSLGCTDFKNLVQISGIIELIHIATLMHDDVVDQSTLRRGVTTINKKWGAPSAILIGDFIYSRAFQLAMTIDNPAIASLLADASNLLAEGEVAQLVNQHNAATDEATYFDIIYKKTGVLFATCCQCAAVLVGSDDSTRQATALLGKNTGIAFQIIDDLLDYTGDAGTTGKQVGIDFYEGKMTLPLIYALAQSDDKKSQFIRQQLGTDNSEAFKLACDLVEETNAVDYCLSTCRNLVDQSIDAFTEHTQPSDFRDQLITIIRDSLYRES